MNKPKTDIDRLLTRWLRGDATAQDEARLTEAARQDPFLAEALSGYRQHPAADHTQRTDRLRQRIAQRSVRSTFRYWRVAAAIALIAVAATLLYRLPTTNQTEAVATTPTLSPTPAEVAPLDPLTTEAAPPRPVDMPEQGSPATDVTTTATESVITSQATSSTAPRSSVSEAQDAMVEESEAMSYDDAAANTPEVNEAAPQARFVPPTAAPAENPQQERAMQPTTDIARRQSARKDAFLGELAADEAAGLRPIFGRILDPSGDPVIGASIRMLDTPYETVTDLDGEFELLADSAMHLMQIDYVGFNSLQIEVPAGGAVSENFTLNNEYLTIEDVKLAAEGIPPITSIRKLEPIVYPDGGHQAFKQYVKDNAARGLPRGRVRLRFKVDADGNPYEVRVEKSNNSVLNSSAMKLLLTGPRWHIVQGIAPVEVAYTVRFR